MPVHLTRVCGRLAAGLLILGLSACGGGGGSAGSPPPPSVAVSAANQDAVTRAAFAGVAAGTLGSLPGIDSGTSSVAALSRSALKQALSAAGALRKRIAADVSSELCPAGGSADASVNDTLPIGELNPGDAVSIRYSSCNVGDGVIVGGNLTVAYTTVTDTELGADIGLAGLSVSDTVTGYSASSDGGFSLSLTATTTTLVSEMFVPDQLVMSSAHLGTAIDTVTLLDGYSVRSTAVSTSATTTTTATGPVASAAAGGFVSIDTPQALVQLDSEDYPRAGRVMVTGLRGTLRATVLSAAQVAIDLDANDDGSYEASKTVAWNTLL